MTQLPPTTLTHDHATPERGLTLADRLAEGEEFAVTFGGQGADWFATLSELAERARRHLPGHAPGRGVRAPASPPSPASWPPRSPARSSRRCGSPRRHPAAGRHHRRRASCMPGVLLTQLATMDLLADEGLDLTRVAPVASVGHSQGIIGVAAFAGRRDLPRRHRQRRRADGDRPPHRRRGRDRRPSRRPRRARRGLPHARHQRRHPRRGPRPRRRRCPRTATPPSWPRSTARAASSSAAPRTPCAACAPPSRSAAPLEAAEIESKTRGGRAFDPTVESIPVALGFHHPALAPAVAMARDWAVACGLDAGLTEHLAQAICVETVDWPRELADAVGTTTRWVVDLGPADLSANMTGRALRGRGVTVIPAATPKGRDQLFTTGVSVPRADDWSQYAPRLIDRGDGKPVVDTAFTRLTGKSPILLAGMTPDHRRPRDRRRRREPRPLGRARRWRPGHRGDLRQEHGAAQRPPRRGPHRAVQHPVPGPLPVEAPGRRPATRPEGPPRRRPARRPRHQRGHPRARGRRRHHRGPARVRHQPRRVQAWHREADPPGPRHRP